MGAAPTEPGMPKSYLADEPGARRAVQHAFEPFAQTASRLAALRAIGTGYLRFAQAENGLFRTAYAASDDLAGPGDPARAGPSGKNPFQLLGEALDQMVAAGVMPAARRPGAEFLAWSAVHGLAALVLDGPLGPVVGPQMEQVGQRLLDMVEQGLSA